METSEDINVVPHPRRNSAKKATAFADQFAGSDSGGSADEITSLKWNGRASAKFKPGKRATQRKRSASVKESTTNVPGGPRSKKNTKDTPSTGPVAVASSSTKPLAPISRLRPRPKLIKPTVKEPIPASVPHEEIINNDDNDDAQSSDLTPLSSSESERRSPSPDIIILNDIHPKTPTQPNPPHAISLATQLAVTSKKPRNEPLWSLSGLGTYVWVLIEPNSWRVFDENEEGQDGKERVWWPGKIMSPQISEIPLHVKLFGAGAGDARIPNPCSGNILSKYGRDFRPRFQTPTFVSPKLPSELDDIHASPKKKQKRDRGGIERTWEAAVADMRLDAGEVMAGSDSSEDFPEVGDMFKHLTTPVLAPFLSQSISAPPKLDNLSSNGSKTGRAKGTRKRRRRSSTSDDGRRIALEDEDEEEMDLPGELVLARDKPATTVSYWPGKLLASIPPATRKQPRKFTIMWLDGTTQDIPRSWFYRVEDDGFAVCKLGKFTSVVVEVQNDEDEDDNDNMLQRSPSPIPLSPPPSMEKFLELSIREQFVYTKPILKAILMHQYEPIHDRHRQFMNGGKQREGVVAQGGLRGNMDPKHVELLQTYIKEWCLREELRVPTGIEDSVDVHEVLVGEVRIPDRMNEDLGLQRPASPPLAVDVDASVQRPVSPAMSEAMTASSPPAIPPSSSLPSTSEIDREGSVISNTSSLPSLMQASVSGTETHSTATTELLTVNNINDDTSELTNMDSEQSIAQPPPTEIPPRQRGCDDFESLPTVTKIQYCSDILLREAIRQILLWRIGARTSAQLLSPQEEWRLYEKGEDLLQEREWVFDVMRMRNLKEQTFMKSRALKQGAGKNSLGRTASEGRMKRQVNYAE